MRQRKQPREILFLYLLILPSFAILITYRVIPLLWNLILSFQTWNFMKPNTFVGLKNYIDLFTDDVFWISFRNTINYFLFGTGISIALATFIAIMVNQKIRGRNVYRAIVFLPYPITPVAIAIIWKWLYNEQVGLINYLLRSIGVVDEGLAFLQDFSLAMPSVIFTSIWQVVGYFVILILTGLQTIPEDLYECAELDGASPFKQFLKITLPLLKPTIFICFIVGIINSFTMFDMIYIMTNGGPGYATEILITDIYKNAFKFNEIGYAAAETLVMFIFFILITGIANRLSGGEAGGERFYE